MASEIRHHHDEPESLQGDRPTVKAVPPPYEEEGRPPRDGPRWPLAVALLNLTGLGLGYLYMKRWLRWLVHLLLTAGLIATVFLTNGASRPYLWGGRC